MLKCRMFLFVPVRTALVDFIVDFIMDLTPIRQAAPFWIMAASDSPWDWRALFPRERDNHQREMVA